MVSLNANKRGTSSIASVKSTARSNLAVSPSIKTASPFSSTVIEFIKLIIAAMVAATCAGLESGKHLNYSR